ncbi:MAG: hypothetical protein MAG453_02193 [Calditrichaeota bacterium]|nr:hypothetical protein [Calditrichota bacterium]
MWIVRWIVLVVIIIAVLWFSLENQETISGVHIFGWQSGEIPLYVALFVAFALGMISFLLIAVFQQLQSLSELARVRRSKKKLENELGELRRELDTLREESEHHESEKDRLREDIDILRDHLDEAERKAGYAPTRAERAEEEPAGVDFGDEDGEQGSPGEEREEDEGDQEEKKE